MYRVVVTPAEDAPAERTSAPTWQFEAEHGRITSGDIECHDGDPQNCATSGGRDVSGLTRPESRVDVDVQVPHDGTDLAGILYGSRGVPGSQALYADDSHVTDITYPATLLPTYRGRVDVPVELTAGAHPCRCGARARMRTVCCPGVMWRSTGST